jgi:hypothetical protein
MPRPCQQDSLSSGAGLLANRHHVGHRPDTDDASPIRD